MGTLQSSSTMGIDIKAGGRIKNGNRKAPTTENVYIRLLVKLYRFLARRTEANFNKIVLKRLFMSRINRPPMSISRIVSKVSTESAQKAYKDKTIAVVGTVKHFGMGPQKHQKWVSACRPKRRNGASLSWHGGYGLITTIAWQGIKSSLLTMSVQDLLIA